MPRWHLGWSPPPAPSAPQCTVQPASWVCRQCLPHSSTRSTATGALPPLWYTAPSLALRSRWHRIILSVCTAECKISPVHLLEGGGWYLNLFSKVVQHSRIFFFRKYRLKAEAKAQQNWAQNWGFLTTPLEEVNINFMREEVIELIILKNKWVCCIQFARIKLKRALHVKIANSEAWRLLRFVNLLSTSALHAQLALCAPSGSAHFIRTTPVQRGCCFTAFYKLGNWAQSSTKSPHSQ